MAYDAAYQATRMDVAASKAERAARAAWDAAAPNAADMVWQAACARTQADNAARYAYASKAR